MFIDLVKAINVIKRPGYIKIVKYCGRLSFLPLNPSVRFGVISSFLFFFTYSINGYWVSDLFQASQLMKEQQIIVNKKWFFMQLDISSLGESDLILGSFWPPMQIQRAVSSSCLPISELLPCFLAWYSLNLGDDFVHIPFQVFIILPPWSPEGFPPLSHSLPQRCHHKPSENQILPDSSDCLFLYLSGTLR